MRRKTETPKRREAVAESGSEIKSAVARGPGLQRVAVKDARALLKHWNPNM